MDYDEYVKLGEINNDISESNKKPTRKSLNGSWNQDLKEITQ